MIDPTKITDYNLSIPELEERILFWVAAAGKNGRVAAKSIDKLLSFINTNDSPFSKIRYIIENEGLISLKTLMKKCGIGCYNNKATTFRDLAYSGADLKNCSAEDLEKVKGIGMKTSRCFILHSRKGARYAGLDTHILKYLRIFNIDYVPKSTPSSKKLYLRLEKDFLILADLFKMNPADLDLEIWNYYSK